MGKKSGSLNRTAQKEARKTSSFGQFSKLGGLKNQTPKSKSEMNRSIEWLWSDSGETFITKPDESLAAIGRQLYALHSSKRLLLSRDIGNLVRGKKKMLGGWSFVKFLQKE